MTLQNLLSQIETYRQAPGISAAQVERLDSLQAQVESGEVNVAQAAAEFRGIVTVRSTTARDARLHGDVKALTSQLLPKPAQEAIATLRNNDMATLNAELRGELVTSAQSDFIVS